MNNVHIERPRIFENEARVRTGFSTRHGGVSAGPFASLNLGLSTGDEHDHVMENRRRLFEAMDLPRQAAAIAGQVHRDQVKVVAEPGLYPGYDAMITDKAGIPLCITAADCAVILLHQPGARLIGAVHSGWRGTVARVVEKTIAVMQDLGARPDRLLAYVSPSICRDHFEVGEEVAEHFAGLASAGGAPASGGEYVLRQSEWKRPHVDLKSTLRDQLLQAGLREDAIEISSRCTYGETHDFYSYRAEQGRTGRMMGFIALL